MDVIGRNYEARYMEAMGTVARLDRLVGEFCAAVGEPVPVDAIRRAQQLAGAVEAFRDLLEEARDMRAYVPDYFAEKWEHDEALQRAQAWLASVGGSRTLRSAEGA